MVDLRFYTPNIWNMISKLEPEEELEFLKEIHGGENYPQIFRELKEAFVVLQTRSQMLLGLATICLTITGFSGPSMAQSNTGSRVGLGFGLTFVLLSMLALLVGPLRLRWVTVWRDKDIDSTLLYHLRQRNLRTVYYRFAMAFLLLGLFTYLLSLVLFLVHVE